METQEEAMSVVISLETRLDLLTKQKRSKNWQLLAYPQWEVVIFAQEGSNILSGFNARRISDLDFFGGTLDN